MDNLNRLKLKLSGLSPTIDKVGFEAKIFSAHSFKLRVFIFIITSSTSSVEKYFPKRAKYKGLVKMQFQAFMQAIVWNVSRLININALPIFAGA